LLKYLEEKENKVKENKAKLEKIIPELQKIKPNKEENQVEVYEGKEGLKTILNDILETKQDILTYGSNGNFSRIMEFYFYHHLKQLEKMKIKMKVIFNYDDTKKPFNWKFCEVRYLPRDYKTPTETTIYGDKVVIFLLIDKPKAILITNKEIADSYRKYFNLLWKAGRKI